MALPESLWEPAHVQRGLLHRHQLYAAGITRDQLRWRLGRGWRAVLPGVVAVFTGAVDDDQRVLAAWLYSQGGTVTGIEAARRHGLRYLPPPGTVRLVVEPPRCRRAAGFAAVTPSERRDAGTRVVSGVPVVGPARAVVDAAPFLGGRRTVSAVLHDAVERRLCTPAELRHETERAAVRGSRWLREALLAAERGTWSAPEADCHRLLCGSAVLPEPEANPVLRDAAGRLLPSPDLWIEAVCLAVQVHSREHHTQGSDFDATLRADAELTAAGAVVLAVSPARLRSDGGAVLRQVEATYLSLLRERRPARIRTEPRR